MVSDMEAMNYVQDMAYNPTSRVPLKEIISKVPHHPNCTMTLHEIKDQKLLGSLIKTPPPDQFSPPKTYAFALIFSSESKHGTGEKPTLKATPRKQSFGHHTPMIQSIQTDYTKDKKCYSPCTKTKFGWSPHFANGKSPMIGLGQGAFTATKFLRDKTPQNSEEKQETENMEISPAKELELSPHSN